MLGRDIIAKIISENGLDKEYNFETEKKTATRAKRIAEPKALGEIAEASFEYGRMVLKISDPIAARKFGLDDHYVKYEFDGKTMFCFKTMDGSSDWSFTCGGGRSTLVASDVETFKRAVKVEMAKQIFDKKIKCPWSILCELYTQTAGHNIHEYTWCRTSA